MAGHSPDQTELLRLRNEVQQLKRTIRDLEVEQRSYSYITEKVLLEETPVMGALRDCFPVLRATPPDLVAQHAALVKSTDDYDNASYPYPSGPYVYIFKCHKDKSLFSKQ